MESLRDVVEAERNRLFVGRRAEMEHLTAWLAGPPAPTQVIAISGMGGIGKSTLLLEILRTAAAQGAVTLWLDGRACTRSPAGFLDYLETLLSESPVESPGRTSPANPVARLVSAVSTAKRLVIIGIDNFDDLAVIEGWLRDDFLPRLPARGVLFLLASRQGVTPTWRNDPAWRQRLVLLPLSPFTRAESREYLERFGLGERPEGAALIRESGGHPLALAVGAEAIQDRWAAGHAAPSGAPPPAVSQAISVHLLREVATPRLHTLLEGLAVLREADQELLAHVLGEPVPPDAYHALTHLSFLRPSEQGLALHDVARAHLLADLRLRAPERFRRMRRRGVDALRARLAAAGRGQRRRAAAQLVALVKDALPALDLYADLAAGADLSVESGFTPEERPILHHLLDISTRRIVRFADAGDEHRLLDALCDRYPETIRIARSPAGEPVGVVPMVLLHRETVALLEQYRLGAVYLKNCPPEERAALDCSPAEADTCFWVMGGGYMPGDDAGTGLHWNEIIGAMFREFFSMLGEGMRGLGGVSDPDHVAFLSQRVGMRVRPECATWIPGAPWPYQVLELDFCRGDFGAWVASFLDAVEGAAPADALEVTAEDLRAALAAIDYPGRLGDTALARSLGLSGRELQELLRDLLTTDAPPAPLIAAHQAVLRTTFLEGEVEPDLAAARLNLSRSTYYRRLRAALAALAALAEALA